MSSDIVRLEHDVEWCDYGRWNLPRSSDHADCALRLVAKGDGSRTPWETIHEQLELDIGRPGALTSKQEFVFRNW